MEINSLLDKGVIVSCDHEPGEFISLIFTVPKMDDNVGLILNLTRLNSFIKNSHFKMDTIHTIPKLMTPNCWMASLDLKDDYVIFQKRVRVFHRGFKHISKYFRVPGR